MNKDEKNFFYALRLYCEMTLAEAGELIKIDKSMVYQYETERIRLYPVRYLIALRKESGLSWETVGELLETWDYERPLIRNKKRKMLKPKEASIKAL